MADTSKFCKFCDTEHPLTKEFWQEFPKNPRCRIKRRHDAKILRQKPENKSKQAKRNKQWREKNRHHTKAYMSKWNAANKERKSQYMKQYWQDNKEDILPKRAEYQRKRRREDPTFRLKCVLRCRTGAALRGGYKVGSAIEELGCDIDELKAHLEKQFYPHTETGEQMTWDNYGRNGWHIDHVQPLCSFDLEDEEQFKVAVHHSNLQPLWMECNLSKSGKV